MFETAGAVLSQYLQLFEKHLTNVCQLHMYGWVLQLGDEAAFGSVSTHIALCQPHAVKIVAHPLARICRHFLVSFPAPCTTMEQPSSGPTKDAPIPLSGISTDTGVEYFTHTCEKYLPILFDIGEY